MFAIQTDHDAASGIVLVTLKGEATMEAAAAMTARLTGVVAARPKGVILDCTGLTILTSICIGELVALKRGVAPAPVVIASAGALIARSLQFTRLDQVFPFYDTVDQARAALNG